MFILFYAAAYAGWFLLPALILRPSESATASTANIAALISVQMFTNTAGIDMLLKMKNTATPITAAASTIASLIISLFGLFSSSSIS